MSGGIKHDQDKPRTDLLSPIAMTEIAKVMSAGAIKYGEHNWRGGIKWSRVLGALLRHTFAFMKGEDKDPETGLSHLAHAGCCIMFLLEYEQTHKELDDRFKKDNTKKKDKVNDKQHNIINVAGYEWERVAEDSYKDKTSGLVWLAPEPGTFTFEQALEFNGIKRKRLPTKKEYEEAEKHGIRDVLDMEGKYWWSGSAHPNSSYYAYVFNGNYGYVAFDSLSVGDSVRCVGR